MGLTDRQISNLVRRIIKEDEEFDMKQTVMKTAGFEEEDIPNDFPLISLPVLRLDLYPGSKFFLLIEEPTPSNTI